MTDRLRAAARELLDALEVQRRPVEVRYGRPGAPDHGEISANRARRVIAAEVALRDALED